ncbi:hypothetical protein ACFLY5_00335 [Patescibacteria group bacterium]
MTAINWKEKIPIILVALVGLAFVLFSDQHFIHGKLLALAFFQNISFSLVSRSRNRNVYNYHLLAAVCSNGVWYLTFSHLVNYAAPIEMIVTYLCGTSLGSLFGQYISKDKIEPWLGATADATKEVEKKKESPVIFIILGIVGTCFLLFSGNIKSAGLLMFLAYFQNIGFALSSRAGNRGSHNYYICAIIASSTMMFITFGYLIRSNMALYLFVPYVVATVFGSVTGAFLSDKIERAFGFNPDERIPLKSKFESINAILKTWWLLILVILLGTFIVFAQKSFFGHFGGLFGDHTIVFGMMVVGHGVGIPLTDIALPLMLFGFVLYAPQSATFIVASRAGNRDKLNYHLCARLINGVVQYMCYKYIIGYRMTPELFVPIVIGMIIGNIFGQQIAMWIENRMNALMDA